MLDDSRLAIDRGLRVVIAMIIDRVDARAGRVEVTVVLIVDLVELFGA